MTDAAKLLEWLNEECCALQPIALATGGGDHDVHWIVVQYHMAEPVERTIGEGRTATEAIVDAMKDENDPTRWAFVPPESRHTPSAGGNGGE